MTPTWYFNGTVYKCARCDSYLGYRLDNVIGSDHRCVWSIKVNGIVRAITESQLRRAWRMEDDENL